MSFSSNFFRFVSTCAFIGGILLITTMILSFGFELPKNIDKTIDLYGNNLATWYMFLNGIFLFFYIVSFWGVTAKKLNAVPGLATTGFIFALADFILEKISYAIIIYPWNDAVKAWTEAEDSVKSTLKSNLLTGLHGTIEGVFSAAMGLLIIALFIYGVLTWKGAGLEKLAGILFFLSFVSIILYGIAWNTTVDWFLTAMNVACPIVLALTFFTIGSWLWTGNSIE